MFGEIIATDDTFCTLLLPDGRESFCKKTELADGTFTPITVTKIMKSDGTWMYYGPGKRGPKKLEDTSWFFPTGVHV